MNKILTKYHKGILILITFCFIIAANLAWLNPGPEKEVFKTTKTTPFFWQYNSDAGIEILTAAYFPKIFNTYKIRMERPTYPIVTKVIGELVGLFISPLRKLNPVEKAAAGHLILKLIIFTTFAIFTFKILCYFVPEKFSFFGVFLLLTSKTGIITLATFHTTELQFITPVFITYMFIILSQSYSHTKNFFFSVLIGILMLAKANYAFYLGFLLYSFFNKRYLETLISFFFHLIPFFIYLFFLYLIDMEFYSYSAEDYGQGVWMFEKIPSLELKELMFLLYDSFSKFFLGLVNYYHIIFIASLIGFNTIRKKKLISFKLFFILILMTWFQEFVANRYNYYMVGDLSIFFYGASSYIIFTIIKNNKFQNTIISALSITWVLFSIFSLTNFPWIHPKNQIERNVNVLNQRVDMIENYENYSDEQRLNAKDGKLIELEKD